MKTTTKNKIFIFNYSVEGVRSMLPLKVTVTSASLAQAKEDARQKVSDKWPNRKFEIYA